MTKKNPTNERVKLSYFDNLRHSAGKSEPTIKQVARSISRLEEFTGWRDFKTFDQRQAITFKADLEKRELALPTVLSTLNDIKSFLGWLAFQPGYKRSIARTDIGYLSLSDRDTRAANAPADKAYPSLPMVVAAFASMPCEIDVEKRDRAMLAFTAITGIRDGALISLKLKHFDIARRLVLQNPSEVNTKARKRIDTFLFPLNDELEEEFLDWVEYLRTEKLFSSHDPLFPKTTMTQDEDFCFNNPELSREHWANAEPVRRIFKSAFRRIDLPEFTPHRFRNMIVSEMYRRKLSIAEFKAWSQNLGHEGAMTTLTSYGKIGLEEQGRLVRAASTEDDEDSKPLTAQDLENILRQRGF